MGVPKCNITDVECENCGTVRETTASTLEICPECCDHENTEEELTRTTCIDCGTKVN